MSKLKICLVASEIAPFAKTGGLADVAAGLSRFLVEDGHDARLIMPLYGRVDRQGLDLQAMPELEGISIQFGQDSYEASVLQGFLPQSEVKVYFIHCPQLYGGNEIYSSGDDEYLRFAMLCRVAIESCQRLQWAPDVFHCNDWHSALIPLFLKSSYAWDEFLRPCRTVLTIHNIGYQGIFPKDVASKLGLGDQLSLLHQKDLHEGIIGFLKSGLLYADAITTVSETYAQEIQTEESGMGLEELLRARHKLLFGIVNGVDYSEWSPEKDTLIPFTYSADDMEGKYKNKEALLKVYDLPYERRRPLFGVVSRLTGQKGFELMPDILPVLLRQEDMQLVILGSGEEKYEKYFQWLRDAFPQQVGIFKGYNNELAHKIEAGSDLFLMPSRYEPCGLNQMYSLKYGTVPIVRKTGGLADTVQAYDASTGEGTGFVFDEFNSEELYQAVASALSVYRDEGAWNHLVQNGMAKDFSWTKQGQHYVQLYRSLSGS